MINILEKENCCGCQACEQRCPTNSITFFEDNEGFLYPKVDTGTCINCSLCENVCPVLNLQKERLPLVVYASKNKDENIRLKSSSGGIFSLLAEKILDEEGVVFGARFNDKWEVVHDFIEAKDHLHLFRGSKYVQSFIGDTFSQTKNFLNDGRKVLFSGTPCQIAGLKLFLKTDYDNLLTVEIVCHGVPSPMIWRNYLSELYFSKSQVKKYSIPQKQLPITNILFRDKKDGWKKYSLTINMENDGQDSTLYSSYYKENPYMRGFLHNLYLRPSCYACPSKSFKSGSDISLADYWGIQNVLPEFDDDKGVSLVILLSEKGRKYFSETETNSIETTYNNALKGNSSIVKSVDINLKREVFFNTIQKQQKTAAVIRKFSKYTFKVRIKLLAVKILVRLNLLDPIKKIIK